MSKSKDFDIFISYSRKDFDEVNPFLNLLKRRIPGLRCWFDLTGIESGDEFMDKIVTAIDKSDKVLFMVSDNSIMSPWTKKEVIYAENTGHTLIPVLLRGAKLKGWFLFNYGLIDSIDSSDPRQVDKLIDNLKEWAQNPGKETPKENNSLICVKNNCNTGYVDFSGKLAIPMIYMNGHRFSEGLAAVGNKHFQNGYIDTSGEFVIPPKNSFECKNFSEGLAAARYTSENWFYDKWGYIDKTGRMVIPPTFQSANDFNEGVAVVENDWKYGFIDKVGNLISPYKYEYEFHFQEGLASVIGANGKYGYINKADDLVINCIYNSTYRFREGLASVRIANDHGYIDKQGNIVIPFNYHEAYGFGDGLAPVQNRSGKWGFIDKTGKLVIPYIYSWAYSFNEGLAAVQNDKDLWGYIDRSGRMVIPCIYRQDIANGPYFHNGLVVVQNDSGKSGVIDKEGNVIVPFVYDEIEL